MLKQIAWDHTAYKIDGKPAFLLSGEFHYFRVPKSDWERRLNLLKEAGGNTVATYIPWILHEPTEGNIVFGDIPQRDLEGFLELCGKLGIFVIARPGPYQYSELKYDGLPIWLCDDYPELLARDINGEIFRKSSVSYVHPLFLSYVRKWFNAVCPILKKYSVKNNGPIAFIQIDNELMGIHQWFSGFDYNAGAMGIGKKGGRYPKFLKEKYEDIQNLNLSYGTGFGDFTDVVPFNQSSVTSVDTNASTVQSKRRIKDYQDFYFNTVADYCGILVSYLKENGVDLDIVHNSPNPSSNAQFKEIAARLGKNFILGSDHYYNLGQDWVQNNPTPQYAVKVFYSLEVLRNMGFPPTVFELPGGSCSDWPPITNEDIDCCYRLNTAFGMKGSNYYIFTGGPNPEGLGTTSDIYDYCASVSANGEIRPLFYIQKNYGKFLHDHDDMADSYKIADFNIGYVLEYLRSDSYFHGGGNLLYGSGEVVDFIQKGLLTTAMCDSISPNLLCLDSGNLLEHTDKPLFVPCSAVMPKNIQKSLVRFVEGGGSLILSPIVPYLDEDFNQCTVISDFLGIRGIEDYSKNNLRIDVGNVKNINVSGRTFACDSSLRDYEIIGYDEISKKEIAWRKNLGKGSVIYLGISWSHAMKEHSQMLDYILKKAGMSQTAVKNSNPNLWTSLRRSKNEGLLFIMNLFTSHFSTEISIKKDDGTYADLGRFDLKPMEVKAVDVAF